MLLNALNNINKKEECDRFEVRKPEIDYEGIKTIIRNFYSIALCLRRKPEHLARFLYKNLASYGEIAGERLILGRKISKEMIQNKISLYVDEYVRCSKCGKPDTELIEEGNNSYIKCLACGTKYAVHSL